MDKDKKDRTGEEEVRLDSKVMTAQRYLINWTFKAYMEVMMFLNQMLYICTCDIMVFHIVKHAVKQTEVD